MPYGKRIVTVHTCDHIEQQAEYPVKEKGKRKKK